MNQKTMAKPKEFRRSSTLPWLRLAATLCCLNAPQMSSAFVSSVHPVVIHRSQSAAFFTPVSASHSRFSQPRKGSATQLNMFMGSDGGILGIGTPELFTILLVGYFILGPSDLYKLTKEIGKFVQNFRTFTTEATASFETNLESQLQLEEIRKAQRELNDAFSFRRSINVDSDTEAFEVNAQSPRPTDETELTTTTTTTTDEDGQSKKKIRRRRRIKKKVSEEPASEGAVSTAGENVSSNTPGQKVVSNVPDLSVEDELFTGYEENADKALREANEQLRKEAMEEEAEQRRKERMERLQQSESPNPEIEKTNASRFQAQLSGNWNDQILEKEDELSPLASIMERLALLEEEKQAADQRLQEEFKLREENEERFYREKRQLLEEAAAQIQAEAYNLNGSKKEAESASTVKAS